MQYDVIAYVFMYICLLVFVNVGDKNVQTYICIIATYKLFIFTLFSKYKTSIIPSFGALVEGDTHMGSARHTHHTVLAHFIF